MNDEIIWIEDASELEIISNRKLENKTVITSSFEVTQSLKSKDIPHLFSDDFITDVERAKLFEKMILWRKWHKQYENSELMYNNVNLLGIIDETEIGTFLMEKLIFATKIKNVINELKPRKIFLERRYEDIVSDFVGNNIEINTFLKKDLVRDDSDKLKIKFNFGKHPLSFKISKKLYKKIKKNTDSISSTIYDLSFTEKDFNKKTIIFVEFNTELFSKLFQSLKDYDGRVVLANYRRPTIWNKETLDIVRNNNCKIFNFESFVSREEKMNVKNLSEEFLKKILDFLNNSIELEKFFEFDGIQLWKTFRDWLIIKYQIQMFDSLLMISAGKELVEKSDIRCLVSLNDIGVTEKMFSELTNCDSIILQHGFKETITDTIRFDKLDYVNFKDKLAVWSKRRKDELIKNFGIDENKIIVTGSPRHDDYFSLTKIKNSSSVKRVLIAPHTLNELNGLVDINLKIRYNILLKKIISYLKKFDGIEIVVKLHANSLKHNDELKSYIQYIDKDIPIYSWTSVKDTINEADVVIVISPEFFATPTMLIESIILEKPIMNFVLDDNITQVDYVRSDSTFTLSYKDDIEEALKKIILDIEFKNQLRHNGREYLSRHLSNHNIASERLSDILKQF